MPLLNMPPQKHFRSLGMNLSKKEVYEDRLAPTPHVCTFGVMYYDRYYPGSYEFSYA